MQIRKQGHCAYRCEYHLVLVSKYRRKIFNDGSFKYFQGVLKQVWENIPEVKLLTINHDTDHIHMHLSIYRTSGAGGYGASAACTRPLGRHRYHGACPVERSLY